jgi:hypothetical protein
MKELLITIGLALLFSLGAMVITIMFVEGWGSLATIISNAAAFFMAGYWMAKIKPKSILWSCMIIYLPFIMFDLPNIDYFKALYELMANPSTIDYKNFYILLPLNSLVAVYLGGYIGKTFGNPQKESNPNSIST